ncbi:glycosyl hydrolase [Powellomyces hirtus]|nr:glycosyl hydrolase [Powellomyces hirtus]
MLSVVRIALVLASCIAVVLGLPLDARQEVAAGEYAGYLFAYFTGEGTSTGEQIYFSVSRGTDALHWITLNNNKPILSSNLGTKGVRDPTVIRVGSGFRIVATDLRMHRNGDWGAAVRNGSRSLVIWESEDLVDWSKPRLVEVSPPTAGMTWAPESVYDPATQQFRVFWASAMYPESDPAHVSPSYHRILSSRTSDFRSFSAATTYIDRGWSVIDTTMVVAADGTWHRFSKDERGTSSTNPNGKFIFQESAPGYEGPWAPVAEGIGRNAIGRGEGPTVFPSLTERGKWYMFIDEFGGRGYVPFECTDLSSGRWVVAKNYALPARPRHGSVVPITQAEMGALLAKWGPK